MTNFDELARCATLELGRQEQRYKQNATGMDPKAGQFPADGLKIANALGADVASRLDQIWCELVGATYLSAGVCLSLPRNVIKADIAWVRGGKNSNLFILDLDLGGLSITDDPQTVLKQLYDRDSSIRKLRLIYRDSTGEYGVFETYTDGAYKECVSLQSKSARSALVEHP